MSYNVKSFDGIKDKCHRRLPELPFRCELDNQLYYQALNIAPSRCLRKVLSVCRA